MSKTENNNHGFLHQLKEPTGALIISLITFVVTLPLFVSIYRYIPVIEVPVGQDSYRLDHILTLAIIYIVVFLLIRKLKKIVYPVIALAFVGLLVSNYSGGYGFRNLYYDYRTILYNISHYGINYNFEENNDPFGKQAQIITAIDYHSPRVREVAANFAVANFKHFKRIAPSLKTLQALSIFKEVRKRWNYIYDPMGEDYYQKASETLKQLDFDDQLKGDCDDYSIIMAALIKSIGGEVQLVRTEVTMENGNTVGHIYPEVNIGDQKDLESIAYLIATQLFKREAKDKRIYYYTDKEGIVWLNFDYNDYYPGGKYQSTIRKSVLKI